MPDEAAVATDSPSPSPRRHARWSRRRKAVAAISLGLVVAIVATVGVLALRVEQSTSQIERVEDAFPDDSLRPQPYAGDGAEPLTYLLLGTDTREQGASLLTDLGSRADTILVVHVPPDRETVQVMSIMRDSWVDIPGYGQAKINAALAYGGVPLLVQVVEGLIAQRIDDVAIIDFEGFEGLTEALDGVTVQNEVPFTSMQGGYAFAAGAVTLRGEQALAYVRERYAFPDGDYQRVRNQQAFMRAVLDRLLDPSVIANPVTATNLVEQMAPYLATTDGLSSGAAIGLGAELVRAGGMPSVQTFTLPTTGTGMVGDQSVVFVDVAGVAVVQEAFAGDSMTGFVPPSDR